MPYDSRRPTETWVRVNVRHCRELGLRIEVLREGEPRRGSVALKLAQPGLGHRILTQTRNAEGEVCWLSATGERRLSEPEADAYLARAVRRDPDLWVVEVEHPEGQNPFRGEVI